MAMIEMTTRSSMSVKPRGQAVPTWCVKFFVIFGSEEREPVVGRENRDAMGSHLA
jgi:hypothetical protein